jgi:hypothetical protein
MKKSSTGPKHHRTPSSENKHGNYAPHGRHEQQEIRREAKAEQEARTDRWKKNPWRGELVPAAEMMLGASGNEKPRRPTREEKTQRSSTLSGAMQTRPDQRTSGPQDGALCTGGKTQTAKSIRAGELLPLPSGILRAEKHEPSAAADHKDRGLGEAFLSLACKNKEGPTHRQPP